MTHCSESNSILWSEYSDTFKDAYGFRPRWFMTEAQVKEDMPSLHKEIQNQIGEEKEREARELQDREYRENFPKNGANCVLTYNPFIKL